MLKAIASLTFILSASAVPDLSVARAQTAASAQPRMTFKSVSVDLPAGDHLFPGGQEAEATNNNCLTCHSAGMVLNQPALPAASWDAEVHKMIGVYKAPIAADDVPAIVAYLAKTKGPQ